MKTADDAFVQEHSAWVTQIAQKLKSQFELGVEVEELASYGLSGLLEARERYDESRGVTFTSFAYYRVRGAIIDGIRRMALLPAKVHARRKLAESIDRCAEEVATLRAIDPGQREPARAIAAIDDILARASAAYVITALGQDRESEDPESQVIAADRRARVEAALESLPERERALVEGFYFRDETLEDIGRSLGISKSWASRLHARALQLLREALSPAAA